MTTLVEYAPFVKGQAERVRRLAVQCPDTKPNRKKNLFSVAQQFEELGAVLAALPPDVAAIQRNLDSLALTPKDIEGLPAELVAQLSLTEGDRQDFEIIDIVEKAGGVISLDHIIIALYRRTKEIHERPKVTARLYRMSQKGMLFNVPGRKGVYSIVPIGLKEEDELDYDKT